MLLSDYTNREKKDKKRTRKIKKTKNILYRIQQKIFFLFLYFFKNNSGK